MIYRSRVPAHGTWLLADRPDDPPLAAWVTVPDGSGNGGGVVIVPPFGYEHSTSYRAWRLLAAALAETGWLCLRVDPYGTGDSPGLGGEVVSVEQWRSAARRGVDWLRAAGCSDVVLVGCRLSAALLLLDAAGLGAVGVVAVAPVLSGRRHVRELRMLARPFPDGSGDLAVAGTVFSGSLQRELAGIEVQPTDVAAVDALLIVRSDSGPEARLVAEARAAGHRAELRVCDGITGFLDVPAEEAEVDDGFVTTVVEWLRRPARGAVAPPAPVTAAVVGSSPRGEVREEFVTVGPDRLAGVLTRLAGAPRHAVLVFLNSGSDPHTGPSRAWAEFARELVTDACAVLRVDFRGWGDSPPGPSAPGRPYDAHAAADARRLVAELHDEGWATVVLAGLCAGAWIALHAARHGDGDAVLALNPQLYWQPGDPVEALMSTTRSRRMAEIESIKRDARAGRWDDEDARGIRPPAGVWLDELTSRGVPVSMVFAAGDDGIEYLRDRLGRRLDEVAAAGLLTIVEVPDVDHGMHQAWRRRDVATVLGRELERLAELATARRGR